jgi:predicted HTH transcriptional regulator
MRHDPQPDPARAGMTDIMQNTERQPVPGARFDDINLNLVREHIETAIKRRGYSGPTNPQEYLLEHGCVSQTAAGDLLPTLAGIVCFAREPHHRVSVCGVDVAQFSSSNPNTSDLVLSRQIRGDLFTIIDKAIDLLWARTEHRTEMLGSERVEIHAYPMAVLRELTVNAVVHRDWSYAGSYIRIQMFPDRIEWISPGGFPGRAPNGVTLETLLYAQVSRNPAIAQVLYNAGKVESFGMGIDTVISALQENSCPAPEVFDNRDIFLFRVWGKKIRNERSNPLANLTPRQRRIVTEITVRGLCTSSELQNALNENVRNIQRDLKELLERNIITAEGATSNRRYRLNEVDQQPLSL